MSTTSRPQRDDSNESPGTSADKPLPMFFGMTTFRLMPPCTFENIKPAIQHAWNLTYQMVRSKRRMKYEVLFSAKEHPNAIIVGGPTPVAGMLAAFIAAVLSTEFGPNSYKMTRFDITPDPIDDAFCFIQGEQFEEFEGIQPSVSR